jgi:adenylosuccinate synthase
MNGPEPREKEGRMPVVAVVGANWGDEGKGKITDYLARKADFVVRYQGGNNAGHTIINEYGKFALHLLPSGVFYPGVVNVMGPGVAVNAEAFLSEIAKLVERGVPKPDVRISERAQVLLPHHIMFDALEEERLGKDSFGSTKSGIAPFYSDKYLKVGLQLNEIFDEEVMRSRLSKALVPKNTLLEKLYGKPPLSVEQVVGQIKGWRDRIEPYVTDTTTLLMDAVDAKKTILLEGQLGTLRDPDHGIYPYPTSSSPLAGFGAVGAGVPPWAISRVVAVTKAYSSCVGSGPFVTELFAEEGEELRKRGGDAGEYGATTGRPRRVGWFDCVATAYGCRVQGATEVAITNLDVLGHWDPIPVCTAYQLEGSPVTAFPVSRMLDRAKPVLESLPGWKIDISGIRSFKALPKDARDYVLFIEKRIGVPIRWISVGPRREQIIVR